MRICTTCNKEYEELGRYKRCFSCRYPHTQPKAVARKKATNKKTAKRRHQCRVLQKKYGITLDQRQTMARAQKWKCLICEKRLEAGWGSAVDHCHATGFVRGILCGKCNKLLGFAEDKIHILERAIGYLQQAKSNQKVMSFMISSLTAGNCGNLVTPTIG